MTPQQQYALNNPALLAIQALDPAYARIQEDGVSIILTVNTGYE